MEQLFLTHELIEKQYGTISTHKKNNLEIVNIQMLIVFAKG